jgi:hypothetical protein
VTGPTGPCCTGATGPRGATGVTGANGATGPTGSGIGANGGTLKFSNVIDGLGIGITAPAGFPLTFDLDDSANSAALPDGIHAGAPYPGYPVGARTFTQLRVSVILDAPADLQTETLTFQIFKNDAALMYPGPMPLGFSVTFTGPLPAGISVRSVSFPPINVGDNDLITLRAIQSGPMATAFFISATAQ